MKRDISKLKEQTFDLVIVGGGIYGATAAWDAASRGLSVALIEKGDFGGGTSANSLKTIHGGLRYLQTLDFKRMRESIRERSLLMHLTPHLVHPLSVVMPTYGFLMKSKHVMWAGMLLNDIVSFDRNKNKDKQKKIPACMVLSKNACLRLLPGIDPSRVTGGAFWTDAQMYNSERVLLSFVLSASGAGAQVANYVEATGFIQSGSKIEGVKAKDVLSGEEIEIRARMVLNTAGGWVDPLLGSLGKVSEKIQLSTAMNLVVNREMLADCAAGVSGRFSYPLPGGGKSDRTHVLFMAPWRNKTIIGTYHRPYSGHPNDMKPTTQDIDAFLKEVNSAWPGDPVKPEEVSYVQKGFLPMEGINEKSGEVNLTKHYAIDDHAEDDLSGLMTVVGVKYTTARDVSEKVISQIVKKLGISAQPCQTRKTRLAGGDIPFFNEFMSDLKKQLPAKASEASRLHLGMNYGTLVKDVLALGDANAGLLEPLPGSKEVIQAEVLYAIRSEMAQTLADVILRRTDLGSAGHPGDETVQACADLMAGELGWDTKRKTDEIAAVNAIYQYT